MIERLDVSINWNHVYRKAMELVSDDWKTYQSKNTLDHCYTFKSYGQKLKIKVKKNGQEKVKLTLPSRALLDLEEYLEPEIQDKLKARGIKLDQLIQEKLSTGMLPGDVFNLSEVDNEFRVWIE
jgi:hypothetical protein